MCVIVHQPKGTHIDKDLAHRLWTRNSDGGGYAFIDPDGVLVTRKTLEWDEWWKSFETDRSRFPGRDFLLHLRIKTHGDVNLDNVHPFQVDEHTVMAHNGIISGVPDYGDGRSDTRVFIDEVLPELPPDWLDNHYLRSMVEEWIGWSKLMFLTNNPNLKKTVYILNQNRGTYKDGMWFSNSNGLTVVKYTTWTSPTESNNEGTTTLSTPRSHGNIEKEERKATVLGGEAWKARIQKDRDNTAKMAVGNLREQSGLRAPITFTTRVGGWICWGCESQVDMKTGECRCWDRLCVDCKHFAGMCQCPGELSWCLVDWDKASGQLRNQAIAKMAEYGDDDTEPLPEGEDESLQEALEQMELYEGGEGPKAEMEDTNTVT